MPIEKPNKIRVQFDIPSEMNAFIQRLQTDLACRSRADLLVQALRLLTCIADEIKDGRRVVSMDRDDLSQCPRYKELLSPVFAPLKEPSYTYLVERSHPWRRQLYIKGRNMTVGQLVYTLRTSGLSAEETAEDLDLPLEAVEEALDYYAQYQGLIELETLEEKRRLEEKGYRIESADLSR